MEEPQCQALGFVVILIFLRLLPNILFNGFFGNSWPNAPDEIACNPDFSSPIVFFQPWEFFEEERCADTFEDLRDSWGSNPRRRARWEVNMVWLAVYLTEFYVVVARNGSENLLYSFLGVRILPDLLTILGAPGKMVPQVVSSMRRAFDYHVSMVSRRFSSPLLMRLLIPQCLSIGACQAVVNNRKSLK